MTAGNISVRLGAAVLALALCIFAAEQVSIAAVNGWWIDELASLWSTDPKLSVGDAMARIVLDPNAPLYYVLLYGARLLVPVPVGDERLVSFGLNVAFMLLAFIAVFRASKRADLAGFSLIGMAAFLLSGPVLAYAPEMRCYTLAMSLAFALSWFAALAITAPQAKLHGGVFAVIGILMAITHLYGAILCGSFAASLVLLGLAQKRRDLAASGLALGLAASCAYAAWFLGNSGIQHFKDSPWIVFSWQNLMLVQWHARQLLIGGHTAAAALLGLLGASFFSKATRQLALLFGGAFAFFIAIPIAVSLKIPIIVDRYWLIGGPALVVWMVFAARAQLLRACQNNTVHKEAQIIGLGLMMLVICSSFTGFAYARIRTEDKLIWKDAAVVAPLLAHCPERSVHVWLDRPITNKPFARVNSVEDNFAEATHLSPTLFADAELSETKNLTLSQSRCPVLGWGEHMLDDSEFPTKASEKAILQLLKLDMPPSAVIIRRHSSGFVVLKR